MVLRFSFLFLLCAVVCVGMFLSKTKKGNHPRCAQGFPDTRHFVKIGGYFFAVVFLPKLGVLLYEDPRIWQLMVEKQL